MRQWRTREGGGGVWTCMRCICVRGVVKTHLERLRDFLGARRAHVVLVQVERRDRLVRLQEDVLVLV